MYKLILFLHAVLSCETTSNLYGMGKGSILKKFRERVKLQIAALILDNPHSIPAQIDQAEESALVLTYNGNKGESLTSLQYKKYCDKMVMSLSQVDPKLSPPIAELQAFTVKESSLR